MTPPAEGERARAQCAAEIVLPEDRTFSCVMDDDHEGIHTFRMNSEGVTRLAAVLRAPQPRGLTGEAIREACATVALEQRCERGTPWDLACTTIAAAIRALNLSAIEGAPAAGEREAVEGLSRFQYAHVIEAWAKAFDAAGGNEPAVNAARKMAALLRGEVVWPWTVPAFIAPASPRSAAPEDK